MDTVCILEMTALRQAAHDYVVFIRPNKGKTHTDITAHTRTRPQQPTNPDSTDPLRLSHEKYAFACSLSLSSSRMPGSSWHAFGACKLTIALMLLLLTQLRRLLSTTYYLRSTSILLLIPLYLYDDEYDHYGYSYSCSCSWSYVLLLLLLLLRRQR